MGHGATTLADHLGVPERLVRRRMRACAGQLPHAFAAAVSALYDSLWDVRGPSAAAARMARERRWCPPLAWDDDAGDAHFIDDPAATPADWRPRRLSAAEQAADLAEVLRAGQTQLHAAWRLGITADALSQRLRRARAQAGRSSR